MIIHTSQVLEVAGSNPTRSGRVHLPAIKFPGSLFCGTELPRASSLAVRNHKALGMAKRIGQTAAAWSKFYEKSATEIVAGAFRLLLVSVWSMVLTTPLLR